MSGPALADGFHWSEEPWGRALRSRPLAQVADHLFTSFPLRLRGGSAREEEEEWARVAATIGVPPDHLLRLHQVHGNAIVIAGRTDAGGTSVPAQDRTSGQGGVRTWPEGDILLTGDPSVALAVQVADCVPLLVADPRSGAVAAAHAGWRGTAAGVAATTVAAMTRRFSADPADLVVVAGPSIGPCCYTVGPDLVEAFTQAGFEVGVSRWFTTDEGQLRLDLWAATRDQLVAAGVRPGNVHLARLCTADHPAVFPSYRRDGKGTGRIAAVVRARRQET